MHRSSDRKRPKRRRSALLLDRHLHSAVLLPPFGVIAAVRVDIRRDRLGFPRPFAASFLPLTPASVHQPSLDRIRALLRGVVKRKQPKETVEGKSSRSFFTSQCCCS